MTPLPPILLAAMMVGAIDIVCVSSVSPTPPCLVMNGEVYSMEKCENSWCVVKGTETYSLDEFVKSGRFCDTIDRHSWVPRYEIEVCSDGDKPCWDFQRCAICERVRKKRVAYTEINEWAE